MKRRSEHLVLKRDGRTEFLRTTKLARSIHFALHSVGVDEDWRAIELANVVLQALRVKRTGETPDATVLSTAEVADAVQHLLVVTGQPAAAVAYGAVAAERIRRRRSLATIGRFGLGAPVTMPVSTDVPIDGAIDGPIDGAIDGPIDPARLRGKAAE